MKFYKNRDWLEQKYIIEKKSATEIGRICNSCHQTILNWIATFNLIRDPPIYANRDWLIQKYQNEQLSSYKIAELCDVSQMTIINNMKKLNVPSRTYKELGSNSNPMKGKKHSNKALKKMSMARKDWIRQYGVPFKGQKHSRETREKISEYLKNLYKNNPELHMPNYSHSQKTREKISIANKGKLSMDKNPNWHGGKSFERYTLDFNNELRERIRERDNYQCQICGLKQNGRKWSVHHINYDKSDQREENLITICVFHHSATNKSRDKWQFFFESYQEIRLSRVS